MAEGLMIHLISEAGLDKQIQVDSCGTSGWHAGELADGRMRQTAKSHGITLNSRSRKLLIEDFGEFDYIIPMDQANLRDIETLQSQIATNNSQVILMRDFDEAGKGLGVPDPYYGGGDGFEEVYQILLRSCTTLLDHIRQEKEI